MWDLGIIGDEIEGFMMCKKLKERFLNEIIKFKKEFNLEPDLFKIGYGVFHGLNTLDCDEFFTPQRIFKGDSFVMGIKLEVIEPLDMENVDILCECHTGTRVISVEHYNNSKFIDVTEEPKRSLCESCTKNFTDCKLGEIDVFIVGFSKVVRCRNFSPKPILEYVK